MAEHSPFKITESTRIKPKRTIEEEIIRRARREQVVAQRHAQIREIGVSLCGRLGDIVVASSRFIDLELFSQATLPGSEALPYIGIHCFKKGNSHSPGERILG